MVLLGHNGAGKTTLIRWMLGLYTDTKQHPFLPEFKEFLDKKSIRLTTSAYAPESVFFDSRMSARDYIALVSALAKAPQPGELLQRVGLSIDPDRPIKEYSKGMRQRLMLALTLIGDPETLVLDEPTSGLDPYGQEAMEALICELSKRHRLVVSTHSLSLAATLSEDIWILCQGRIAFHGQEDDPEKVRTLMQQYRPEKVQ